MRRILTAMLLALVLLCLLAACAGKNTEAGALPLPFTVAQTVIPGTEYTVALQMVTGERILTDSPEFAPGGGMQGLAFDENYVGEYQLIVERDGETLSRLPVEFEGETVQNYTVQAAFDFQYVDYNGDGLPDFALGCGGVGGSNKLYNLYSVNQEGRLSLLHEGVEHFGMDFTPVFDLTEDGFYTLVYDGNAGETAAVRHRWTGASFESGGPEDEDDILDTAQAAPGVLQVVLLQRGGLDLGPHIRVGLRNDPDNYHASGLLGDIDHLLWVAPRGGYGVSERGVVEAAQLEAVQDSGATAMGSEILWTDEDNRSDATWVRLLFSDPAEGEEPPAYRDVLLFVNPASTDDAVLACQLPDTLEQWRVYDLSGYGQWLAREIDLLIRVRMGR